MWRVVTVLTLLAIAALSAGCPGTVHYLSGSNIDNFRDCTIVEGSLVINQMSLTGDATAIPSISPVTLDQLSYLATIEQISGYLHIHDCNNITNLRFLRNLEVINGAEIIALMTGEYALIIEDNSYLQTIGLSSLKRIKNGGIRISTNPQLCLVDTLTLGEFIATNSPVRTGGLGIDCSGYTCHEQCSIGRGCWGTLTDECVVCRNYDYLGTCLQSCDLSVSYVNDSTNQCVPLALPTTIDVSTLTMSTIASTSAHPHTQLQPVTQATNESTPATSMPTDNTLPEHLFWPIMVGCIVMATILLITLLATLIAVCYCCYRSNSSKNLMSLPRTTTNVERDNNSYHSRISLRDLNSRKMWQNSVRSNPSNNPPTIHCQMGTSYDPEPEGSPTSITRLLKDNPTSSEVRTQQYSKRSSPETEFRQRQNLTTPGTMHGGIYSTRTPPSHPHKFSGTPHTHRGSLSSVQGGTSSRSSGVPSRSSNTTTANNNSRLELRTSASD